MKRLTLEAYFHLSLAQDLLRKGGRSYYKCSTGFLVRTVMVFISGLLGAFPSIGQELNRQAVSHLVQQLSNSQPDTSKIKLLVKLGEFHLHKPGRNKADLDSSWVYLQQAQKLSDSLCLLKRQHEVRGLLVVNYIEAGNDQFGRSLFAELIKDCRQTADKEAEADARYALGVCLTYITENYTEILDHHNQALAIYWSLNKPEKAVQALREIASIHLTLGQLTTAEKEFLEVTKRCKSLHCDDLQYTYDWLAYTYRLKGEFDKSLWYSMKAIETINTTHDTLWAGIFYGSVAQTYLELGKREQSIEWHKKTLQKWRQSKLRNPGMYHAANVVARDMADHHQAARGIGLIQDLIDEIPPHSVTQKGIVAQGFAYCYNALKNKRLAEKYYLDALMWYGKAKHDSYTSRGVQQEVGKFYLEQNYFTKAGFYLRPLLKDSKSKSSLSSLRDIYFMLFRVDSANGNYQAAIEHFRMHKLMNDSIFTEVKNKQFTQLEIQYQTRKNKQNIALLQKQSKLQKSELRQTRTVQSSLIGGFVLLIGLLGLSYNRYRIKQRSNQLLEAKQSEINQQNQFLGKVLIEKEILLEEKELLLREIHHRVKNNLQIISSLLQSQREYLSDEVAIDAIEQSQHRVRAIALIHQKLYQSDSLAYTDVPAYIVEVVEHLSKTFDPEGRIIFQFHLAPLELTVTQAVPLGLILNEAVTNALKYAFPVGYRQTEQGGTVELALVQVDAGHYLLVITDNGVGLPDDVDLYRSSSMGATIMRGLTKQLGGSLQVESSQGVTISVPFTLVTLQPHFAHAT